MGTLMAFFFCAVVVMLLFLLFLLIRVGIASSWNSRMSAIALREEGHSEWYMRWDITDAVWNPRHYNKWTTAQWVKYQKALYGETDWWIEFLAKTGVCRTPGCLGQECPLCHMNMGCVPCYHNGECRKMAQRYMEDKKK